MAMSRPGDSNIRRTCQWSYGTTLCEACQAVVYELAETRAGSHPRAFLGRSCDAHRCHVCHIADASGRMAPSPVHEGDNHERSHTDVGLFAIIYGGAAGAIQSLNERLTPDEILRVIAYVRSLRR